jgi:hypothetical protein
MRAYLLLIVVLLFRADASGQAKLKFSKFLETFNTTELPLCDSIPAEFHGNSKVISPENVTQFLLEKDEPFNLSGIGRDKVIVPSYYPVCRLNTGTEFICLIIERSYSWMDSFTTRERFICTLNEKGKLIDKLMLSSQDLGGWNFHAYYRWDESLGGYERMAKYYHMLGGPLEPYAATTGSCISKDSVITIYNNKEDKHFYINTEGYFIEQEPKGKAEISTNEIQHFLKNFNADSKAEKFNALTGRFPEVSIPFCDSVNYGFSDSLSAFSFATVSKFFLKKNETYVLSGVGKDTDITPVYYPVCRLSTGREFHSFIIERRYCWIDSIITREHILCTLNKRGKLVDKLVIASADFGGWEFQNSFYSEEGDDLRSLYLGKGSNLKTFIGRTTGCISKEFELTLFEKEGEKYFGFTSDGYFVQKKSKYEW